MIDSVMSVGSIWAARAPLIHMLTLGLMGVCKIMWGKMRLSSHPMIRTCRAVGVARWMNGLDATTPDRSETVSFAGGMPERVANARTSAPP